ncbi:Ig-like domain-containing protein [Moraxella nasovis]|uniref:Ig-like domain-containing protein n=1 Tax=Moraxella nasovis TaxID=2904121 RepID=UPI001F615A00|nr:Ig-like domain-containing protein [Moraxella nasovis]UNU73254.1 Ig-like domain-containing protein [Moraxella nasovis]
MKNIIVKVQGTNQTLGQIKVVTKDGKPTSVKTQHNANYEFIDEKTGVAPDHIVTKRVGNDLHIALDDDGATDLILEDFYDSENIALIGQAENGEYYYYIPDTGEVADYVTNLALGDIEGQALGGSSLTAPWWAGVVETKAAIWPWLLGLAALGGIAAAAGGSKDATATPTDTTADAPVITASTTDGSVTVKPGSDNKKVDISFTGEDDKPKQVVAEKGDHDNNPNTPDTWKITQGGDTGATINPNTGVITIPQDAIKDGSPGKATSTDDKGNTANATDVPAGNDIGDTQVADGNDAVKTLPDAQDEGGNLVTTIKLTNDHGGSIPVPTIENGNGNTPGKANNDDFGTPTYVGKDKDGQPVENGVTKNGDQLTIKPGVQTIEVTTPIKNDNTTEGNETAKVVVDGKGNEVTINDTSKTPDTTAPSAPVLTAKDDGTVDVEVPTDANAGDTVEVKVPQDDGSTTTVVLTKQPDGSWESNNPDVVPSIDAGQNKSTIPADKVKDGETVTAKAKDPVGNESNASTATAKTPDTTAPSAPVLTAKDDGTVDVEVPTDANAGDTVEVKVPQDDGSTTTVVLTKQPDGSWESNNPDVVPSIDAGQNKSTIPADKVKDGETVTAKAKDPVGNESNASTATAKTPDTTAPSAPVLTAKDDGTVDVEVPTDANAGDTVEVKVPQDDGSTTTVVLTKQPDGSWESNNPDVVPSIDAGQNKSTIPADKVKDGETVTAKAKDPVGNESNASTATAKTPQDTQVADGDDAVKTSPNAQDEGSDLTTTIKLTNDHGGSIPAPTIEGGTGDKPATADDFDLPGQTFVGKNKDGQEVPDGVTKNGDQLTIKPGVQTIEVTTPIKNDNTTEGDETAKVVVDGKGNEVTINDTSKTPQEPKSQIQEPKKDTTPPAKPETAPDMTADTDTGTSNTDNITNDTTPSFTVPTPVNADDKPVLLVDGNEVPATAVKNDDGTTTLTPDAPLPQGSHTITSAIKDPAGNISEPSPALDITIDSEKPAKPETAPDMTADTDTGTSNTDNITNDTTPSFTVPTPVNADDKPVLLVDGNEVPATAVKNDDGTTTLTPDAPLPQGSHTITSAIKDPAGNISEPSPALDITIDSEKPAKPETAPDMTADTDTGTSNTDNITNDTTPSFTVPTPVNADDKPVLLVDGNEVPATAVKNDDGTTTLTPDAPLPQGSHTITSAIKDPAGNISEPSPALDITIDSEKPAKPETAPDMTADTDTGTSNTDNITNDTTPSFTVPTPVNADDKPVLLVDGNEVPATAVKNDDGTTTLTPDAPLPQGSHTITSAIKDPAGNISEPSPALDITIDSEKPAKPETAPDMTADTDTGTSNTDNITNDTTPSFTVPTPVNADDKPVLLVDGNEVPATAVKNDDGTTTLTPDAPLPQGSHTITSAIKDPAGNISEPSPALDITIDSEKPAKPTVAIIGATDQANGKDNDGKINKTDLTDNKATIKVTLPNDVEVGDTLTITVPNADKPITHTVTAKDKTDGFTTTFTPNKEGEPNEVTAKVTDKAGNPSIIAKTSAITDLIIPGDINGDGTADDAGKPVVAITTDADDDGNITPTELGTNTDLEVKVTLPKDAGYSAGDKLVINVNGSDLPEYRLTTADLTNGYTTTFVPKAKGEENVVTAKVTDGQGNTSSIGEDTATIAAPPVKLTLSLAQDTGSSDSDNITNNPTVNVANIPQGAAWEYSLDGGRTWKAGTGSSLNMTNPEGRLTGQPNNVIARVKGDDTTQSNALEAIYDDRTQVRVIPEIENSKAVLKVLAEPNSTVLVNKRNITVDSKGVATISDVQENHPYNVSVTDKAGNVKTIENPGVEVLIMPNIYGGRVSPQDSEERVKEIINQGSPHDIVLVGKKATNGEIKGYGDVGGNPLGDINLSFGSGNDALVATTVMASFGRDTTLNFDAGDDSLHLLAYINNQTAGSHININMGAGNDYVKVDRDINDFSIPSNKPNSVIDLGAGNDYMYVGGHIHKPVAIKGGAGYDELHLLSSGFNERVSGFEKIVLEGLNNKQQLDLTLKDVINNNQDINLHYLTIDGKIGKSVVDLGANGGAVGKPNFGGFQKVLSYHNNGKHIAEKSGYDAYWDGNDLHTLVYIQHGIAVI